VNIKTPRLIRDRCGVYYFRFIVPLNWRETVGRAEIRRSLRTKDAATARHAALLLSARMESLMVDRKFLTDPTLADFPHLFVANPNIREKIRIDLNNGIVETDTLEEAKEARGIVAGMAKARTAIKATVAELPSSRCGTNLEQAASDFLVERKTTLSEKGTIPKFKGVLRAFIAFAGNLDVAMVQAVQVKNYKKKLLGEKKAPTTINDHLVVLAGFFDYCIDNQLVQMQNPARGLLIPGAHNKAMSYLPFTNDEMAKIFAAGPYLKRMKLPDYYWGPLIAAFTGARAEEIASLEVGQIYPVKGIWLIDITKGKTENAVRRVPIHEKLLELGLLDYCKAIKDAGHVRFFPHLVDGKNGFKKNMCRTFGNHLDAADVDIKHPLKVFHSFRHTVVTALTDAGVNDGLKRALVGHDIDTRESSHDDYIHARFLTLANLQEAINKLAYGEVDFSGLRVVPETFLAAVAKRIAG
jgi:integrase